MHDDSLHRLRLPAGMLLFEAGDPGNAAYLVESGCLEIFLERAGDDLVLARRSAGEIVGEMSLLDKSTRSASVRAIEDTSLVLITEQQIAHRLDETDPILRMCLGTVIDRYRQTVAMLQAKAEAVTSLSVLPAKATFNAALESLVLEREMRAGIERAEFELYFQPITQLETGKLTGFEALMRWNHPKHGFMMPGQFIPLAETSGLIVDLTSWAFGEVGRVFPTLAEAALRNRPAVLSPLFMSVNVSGHDLAQPSFMPGLADMLRRAGIHPNNLKIEVTESVLMKNPERAAAALAVCRAGGLGIAIDDFGTGYSSLSYLSTLPITTLKIDRAFVCAMLHDGKSRKIVQTILRLAEELDIPVVAEGIEEAAEAEALRAMGCAFGQGYLFGKPTSLRATQDLVHGWALTRLDVASAVA